MPKRLRELQIRRFSDVTLPDDLLCHVILVAFDYRLDERDDYDALQAMRRASIQFRRVIDQCVVPNIRELGDKVARALPLDALLEFQALRRLNVETGYHIKTTPPDRFEQALRTFTQLETLSVSTFIDRNADNPIGWDLNGTLVGLTRLTSLTLYNTPLVTDAVLQPLTRLRMLALSFSEQLTDAALQNLGDSLQTLLLGLDMVHIVDLSALKSLTCLYCFHDDDHRQAVSLASLAQLPNLTQMHKALDWHDYSDERLGMLTGLHHLSLHRLNNVTDAGLSALNGLRTLDLQQTPNVSEASLSLLTNLYALHMDEVGDGEWHMAQEHATPLAATLQLLRCDRDCRPTGHALATLVNLTCLDLSYNDSNSPEGMRDEQLALLVNLRILDLSLDSGQGLSGRSSFPHLTALTALDISWNDGIDDDALILLAPSLRALNLYRNTRITDNAVRKLTRLTRIAIPSSNITNDALRSLPLLDGSGINRINDFSFFALVDEWRSFDDYAHNMVDGR